MRRRSIRKGVRETAGFFYSHHRHPKTIHLHTRDDEHIIFHADKSKKWLRILIKFSNAEVLQRGNRASFTHPVAIETITTKIKSMKAKERARINLHQAPQFLLWTSTYSKDTGFLIHHCTPHQRIPTNLERTELVHQLNCILQLTKLLRSKSRENAITQVLTN